MLVSPAMTGEAIRLTRELHRVLADDSEVAGLLALMLLTDARRPARTRADGALVPLAEQDRAQWHQPSVQAGTELISRALSRVRAQIVALYDLLERIAPNPMVTLNRAVALGMARGPQAGLALLATLDTDARLADHHRLDAVRAHLLEMAGDHPAARTAFDAATRRTTSVPKRRYPRAQVTRLAAGSTAEQ